MRNKVEITGINTSNLKTIPNSEMMELIKKSQSGDKESRDMLVEGNLKLVLSVVKRFNNRGENLDDLFQIGVIGLIKAIDNFDFTHGVKFSTYAVPMIIGEIRRYLRDNSKVRIPRSLSSSGGRSNGQIYQEGSLRGSVSHRQGREDGQDQDRDQNLVPSFPDHPGLCRSYLQCPQRQDLHPGVHALQGRGLREERQRRGRDQPGGQGGEGRHHRLCHRRVREGPGGADGGRRDPLRPDMHRQPRGHPAGQR